MESLRILKLLLLKNFLVCKRQWILSTIGEIVIPVGIMICIWAVRNESAEAPTDITSETFYRIQSKEELINSATTAPSPGDDPVLRYEEVYYAPSSNYTMKFMDGVKNCFKGRMILYPFETEESLLQNEYVQNGGSVLIFDGKAPNSSTKTLQYRIRGVYLLENQMTNRFSQLNLTAYNAYYNHIAQLQICIDETFIKSKMKSEKKYPEVFIQQVPYPPYTKLSNSDFLLRELFGSVTTIVFMIPLFIETARASSEKFLGINVLMSMNGVSNFHNLFSWLISGWSFLTVFCVLPIFIIMLLSTGDVLPFLNYGNPFIIFLVYFLYVGHLLAYGIHVSAYFSRSLLVMFALLILHVGSDVIRQYGFNEDTYWIAPYFGLLFPNILLFRAVEELNHYESIAEGVQWYNIFTNGIAEYKVGGSIGMLLILFTLGIFIHFSLAIYIYAINPGKYGVRKHPLFFFKREKYSENVVENLEDNDTEETLYETVPKGADSPGIQIRNLKKDYDLGFFSGTKVRALRDVSIDLYKGQITSLLGHNGAGKTTMMSILTGMMSPSAGSVLVNAKDIKYRAREILNDMGLCTQENMVFPNLSVKEQLDFFAMLKGNTKEKEIVKQEVENLLEKLKLKDKENSLPKQLSGGQKRRLCLGMALVGNSSILILDEPTSGLDPESRRVIWDVLLKMRGQKTILISTHNMEEADILGDRIAILHKGKLKSYGTSLFLKKSLGKNNVEVNLSIEPWCNIDDVCRELNIEKSTLNQNGSKLVTSIPTSLDMPDLLDRVERKKKDLGISGLSASLISLEQVFLKVTQEDNMINDVNAFTMDSEQKLEGQSLMKQQLQALLRKKMTYTLKNMSTILVMILLIFTTLLSIAFVLKDTNVVAKSNPKIVPARLDIYNHPESHYKSDDDTLGKIYKDMIYNQGGIPHEVHNSSLTEELMSYAKQDSSHYTNYLIAGAEFNLTKGKMTANALYSGNATYGLPISMNLVSNSLAKSILGDDYSIEMSIQAITLARNFNKNPLLPLVSYFTTAVIFVFFFCPAMAVFVLHPLRESSTSVKHLQRMAGVSSFSYWGVMFLFDLIVFWMMIGLVMIGFLIMDYSLDLELYARDEIWILLLTLTMFAINSLPIVYIFSFTDSTASSVVRLLSYIPIGTVTFEVIMIALRNELGRYASVRILRSIQKRLLLLVPYVSLFHSQAVFHKTTQVNARCKNLPNAFYDTVCGDIHYPYNDLCCFLGCYDGKCQRYRTFFTNFENDITLEESLVYLGITSILYFGILFVLDNQVIQKFRTKMRSTQEVNDSSTDEQVMKEKLSIAQTILEFNENELQNIKVNGTRADRPQAEHSANVSGNRDFLVYELRKQYGKLMAVKDVSFGVKKRECFGLLGVNGAGKSTTFRMMTGMEIPDNGVMYIGNRDIDHHREFFLSQMGYCPQHDAIVKSLNAYDHLRLFGRIRGIPENQIEDEVHLWIQKLNLNACALQPSGMYSGGNKRRLNIAIALIANPRLVLMDEPTTGVDPGARRSLWNVIKSCQEAGQAIVLTSHSMEECEALCDRLAIMVDGKLVCIGPSQELKQRFGAGYDIQIKLDPLKAIAYLDNIKEQMSKDLNCQLMDENVGYLMYHVSPVDTTWRKMYNVMNIMKKKYDCVDDFSVQSSTLEQLFLLFAKRATENSSRRTE